MTLGIKSIKKSLVALDEVMRNFCFHEVVATTKNCNSHLSIVENDRKLQSQPSTKNSKGTIAIGQPDVKIIL